MSNPSVSITFHEDFRQPFATWALGTMIDGDKKYAVVTCMPVRKPVPIGRKPPSFKEWDDAAHIAASGLTALLQATTPAARARITGIVTGSFEIVPFATSPMMVEWDEVEAVAERVRQLEGAKP